MKSGTSFLFGIAVGVAAIVLSKRLREIAAERDQPERVVERISDSLDELERRAAQLEERISEK